MVKPKKNKQTKNKAVVVKFEKVAADQNSCDCVRISCLKKLFIFILGAIVGVTVCHAFLHHFSYGGKRRMLITNFDENFDKKFVNGCFDTSDIEYPEVLEAIKMKDADKNGCITKKELFESGEVIKVMNGKMNRKSNEKIRLRNR